LEIEALKLKSEADSPANEQLTDYELEAKVFELIQNGYHSPSELSRILGISKDKLSHTGWSWCGLFFLNTS